MDTQVRMVLSFLDSYGSITQKQAWDKLGVSRLSAVIFRIKEAGIPIKKMWERGVNRFGTEVNYVRYYKEVQDGEAESI